MAITVADLLLPVLLPLCERVRRVSVRHEEWRWIEELRDHRALLLPNHPSETDPILMAWLARRLGQPFDCVATHELFRGLRGWVVRRTNAFSVLFSRPDLPWLRTPEQLLAILDCKVVLFPEGETHLRNDLIGPLDDKAMKIGFMALERLEERGRSIKLPVVPVVMKYHYLGHPLPALTRGLRRLEKHLGLASGDNALCDRLWRAALTVLSGVEREYGLEQPTGDGPGRNVDDRLRSLHQRIAARVAQILPMELCPERPVRLGARELFAATSDYLEGLVEGQTPYDRRRQARQVAAARACLKDLSRLQNLTVTLQDRPTPPMEPERFGELLWHLEAAVFGRMRTRLWREAIIRLGPPMDLADRLTEYRKAPRATVGRCTEELEERLRSLLRSLDQPGASCEALATTKPSANAGPECIHS
jgi:1-acyl-sn-glycerol-3-phosphate acyltransferase